MNSERSNFHLPPPRISRTANKEILLCRFSFQFQSHIPITWPNFFLTLNHNHGLNLGINVNILLDLLRKDITDFYKIPA